MHKNDFDAALLPGFRAATAQEYRELMSKQSQDETTRLDDSGELLAAGERRACPLCGARHASPPLLRKAGLRLVRCLACRMVYSETVLEESADQAIYAENAFQAAYLRLKHNASYASLEARKSRYIVECLARYAPRAGSLLEVGSGAGRLLDAAREAGWMTLGIEANPALVAECRDRGLEVIHGWFPDALPPGGRTFHAAAMLDVVEHSLQPVALLQAVRRVLEPGGVVILQAPNFDSLIARLEGAASNVICQGHWNYFSCDSLVQCADRAGLRALHVETIISELDRVRQFPAGRIREVIADIGAPAAAAESLDVNVIHEHRMGHKVLGLFQAA